MIPIRREYGVSRFPPSSRFFLTANEKDFSLSLEMTIRGKGFAIGKAVFSLLPPEGGAPKGRRLDGDSGISETKPSPRGEGGERSEPDRVLAV